MKGLLWHKPKQTSYGSKSNNGMYSSQCGLRPFLLILLRRKKHSSSGGCGYVGNAAFALSK